MTDLYKKMLDSYNAENMRFSGPDFAVTSRDGLRRLLEQDGWDKNKIRRYLRKLDKAAKSGKAIESPGLFETDNLS